MIVKVVFMPLILTFLLTNILTALESFTVVCIKRNPKIYTNVPCSWESQFKEDRPK